MMNNPRVAIVGATGAVGVELLSCLESRNFPLSSLKLLASKRSAGKQVAFRGEMLTVEELTKDSFSDVDLALFAAGGDGYQIASIGYPTLCISSSQSSSRLAAKADAACAPVAQCHYLVDTHPSVKAGTDNVEDAYHITATDS